MSKELHYKLIYADSRGREIYIPEEEMATRFYQY